MCRDIRIDVYEITFYSSSNLVAPFLQQFLSGVVRKDATTSLLLMCRVDAVPPTTFVEIRRRSEGGDMVLNSVLGGSRPTLTVQYTLGNLMLNDSGVYVCVANNSIGLAEENFTLVVQGEWNICHIIHSILILFCKLDLG